jgi:hypothetical protein
VSVTVLLIGVAHGVPVVVASILSKQKWIVIAVALGMLYVAVNTGRQTYLGIDLLGIIAGTIFAWFFQSQRHLVEIGTDSGINKIIQKTREGQCELHELNQWRYKAAKEFGNKLLVKWTREGLWKESGDSYGIERKRAICEKLVRCYFDPSGLCQDELDEDFAHQIMAEAKDYDAGKRILSGVVLDCLDLGILPPKQAKRFRENYERGYEEARKRLDDERLRQLIDLANQQLGRQKSSAPK